jgi:hypothetical protein
MEAAAEACKRVLVGASKGKAVSKRAPGAYALFIKTNVGAGKGTMKDAAEKWKGLGAAERATFEAQAAAARAQLAATAAAPAEAAGVAGSTITLKNERALDKLVAEVSAAAVGAFLKEMVARADAQEPDALKLKGVGTLLASLPAQEGKKVPKVPPVAIKFTPARGMRDGA